MTSLAEVYEGHVGTSVTDPRRLYLGTGLLLGGAVATVAAMVAATTGVLASVGLTTFEVRSLAGILGGLGVPAMLMGVITVLPGSQRNRAAATIGASVAVLGVVLFWHAYPYHWMEHGDQLTPLVSGVYFFGMVTVVWCLFTAVANFKTRNEPGGTVSLKVTKGGETKVVEVDRSELEAHGTFGSVGTFGNPPDEYVETQTNRAGEGGHDDRAAVRSDDAATVTAGGRPGAPDPEPRSADGGGAAGGSNADDAEVLSSPSATGARTSPRTNGGGAGSETGARSGDPSAASDGGAATRDLSSPMDGADTGGGVAAELNDRYCGNCAHFEYVRTNQGMQPYCGNHEEFMDDMEACEEWRANWRTADHESF